MFKIYLQLMCLPFVLLAANSTDTNGRWDWIKTYQITIAGGHWILPRDLGYSMHMNIRNDSVYTYHSDTLVKSGSFKSLSIEMHSDTLVIMEYYMPDAGLTSYWKKATTNVTSGTIKRSKTANKNIGKEKFNLLGRRLILIDNRKNHLENTHARLIRIY
jgi:hypothetical protein